MHHRLFRTILLMICLLGLVLLSRAQVAGAATHATHTWHSFQPSGHGTSIPKKVNTATMPQVQGAGSQIQGAGLSGIVVQHTASSRRATVPAPSNVVIVPAATSTDSTAKPGFSGQGFKPDANGAGGTLNYLETTNAALTIYGRGGKHQLTSTYHAWFGTGTFFDPVTTWDSTGSRFIFSVLQTGVPQIWLSVAQQTDATGSYCNYSFPTPSNHDFDKLGVDSDGIYFGFNVLDPSTGNVIGNELFFVSRVALESGLTATYTNWTNLTNPDGTIAQAITPARQDGSAAGVEYLVNSYPAGACQLTLWTLTSSGTLSNITVPTQCYSPPTKAKQLGSAALIDTGDCSITQASYVNGLLTVDTPGDYDFGDGNGPVGIVEWYVLNPSTASIASQGAFGTPGYWLFYPSTIKTPNGHMLFLYNASGASIYPSVWHVNQTLTGTRALVNGTSYFGTTGNSPWGDYQSAWPDSSVSPNSVWITGEYGKTSTTWGTKFNLIIP